MATDTSRLYRQAKRLTNRVIKKNQKARPGHLTSPHELNQWRAILAMFRRKLNAGQVPSIRRGA